MGKAVNYNDIVEIIKSDIKFIDDIVDVINSSIEDQSKALDPALVDVLTSNINLVGVIINQINDFYGKVDFKNVDNFLSFLKTSTEKISEMSKLQGPVDYNAIIKCIQNLSNVFSHALELQNIDIKKLDKDIKSYVGVVDSIISITERLITLSKLSGRVDRNAIVKYIQGLSKIINSISLLITIIWTSMTTKERMRCHFEIKISTRMTTFIMSKLNRRYRIFIR